MFVCRSCVIQLIAHHQAAPVAAGRLHVELRVVHAQQLVVIRSEEHAEVRRSQDLQRALAAVNALRGTAHVDVRLTKLEYCPGVDHHRYALGHFHTPAVL